MNKTKFMQTDSRWGGLGYPKKPWYIRNCGCGECSIANVIIEMDKYASYTPATIQPYCKQFADPNGNGTYHSGIPKMMEHYGLTEVKEHATMSSLWTELAKGDRVAIYLFGKREAGTKHVRWTSSGHFTASVDFKYVGNEPYVYMKDSYSNSSNRNGWISYTANMRGAVLKVWSGKVQTVEPTSYRPSTPYTGTLPTASVKSGVKGEDTKACQTFLNWCVNPSPLLAIDGSAGKRTINAIKVFQKTYGLGVDGSFGKKSREKAQEIIKEHEVHPYDGEYPNPIVTVTVEHPNTEKVVDMAKKLAWPVGTASSKYAYKGGSATAAFKAALDKVFPKHNSWSKAASKGASCDVFAATVMNSTGIVTNMPRGYDEQVKYTNANLSKITRNNVKPLSVGKAGDMILYTKSGSSHHVIILGNGVIYEAQYEKTYGHVNTSTSKINTNRPKVIIFRAKGTYKTTTTRSYLMRGDKGDEVRKLQQYINWFFRDKYGKDVLTVDGKFGPGTESYAKLMQSDLGFTDCDGLVGSKTIEAMKGWKQ